MDLFRAMQVFTQVAECRSFSQTAERLSTSTSVVTRHVSCLEKHLGIRLFQRTTRKVVLTQAGAEYADGCRDLLRQLEAVESRATTEQTELSGEIRIVALGSFSLVQLTPLFADYQARFPRVNLNVTLTERRVDLLEGGFEVGIVSEHMVRSETLILRRLISSFCIPVASPDYLALAGHPKTPADLKTCRVISVPTDTAQQAWVFVDREGKQESVTVQPSMTVNSVVMQMQLALNGMGVALLPNELVADALRARTLVHVLDAYSLLNADVAVSLVYPSRDFVSRKVRAFINLAVNHFS
ncbi:LysR family transcriptional regulator [Paraburkholderia phenoliruptrix]|uniref:LysR family transcriptional regulator n=1 Tax=Paraburkholderia phenoliruptrix TaxID=252970 RepID=UPI001C6F46E2|nr:LysR family transcriptional regulator [Paraburkholderia phenoliruptrix]MBW9103260.1 LysR family transcriptional regulator [Paraburkholderia phenoliruptrix]MBW9128067.1 LysR family transcriptional regulator [Paraburkholderia ginsengiterrae]